MSQIGPSTPPSNRSDGLPITSLTLLIILLLPCVVLLLLLNCLFLGYKLHICSKKNRKRQREDYESMLQSTLSMRQRMTRISETPLLPNQDGKGDYISVAETIRAQPSNASRTSSKERAAVDQRIRFIRPDGATGGGLESLRTSAPVLPQSSDSEVERPNLVPPNSPFVTLEVTSDQRPMRRCSTMELLNNIEHQFDMVDFECEYTSNIPPEMSCFVVSDNYSTMGPGLDSDFGASAGVSLRILSADSDGLNNGVWDSGMEWDYYDPCYVREKNIPKQKHHMPALHTKHYWV
uniref:Huluwa n=1 Tax=Oncorhynchus kisutch TaxID=8019 RepID=A0A8C7MUU6_ONCKI